MNVAVFSFGKLKLPGLREAADVFVQRMQPWARLEEIELKPERVPEKSADLRLQIQAKESTLLLERVKKWMSAHSARPGMIVLLDERGKNWKTQNWADQLREWEDDSVPSVAFCVGSSLGFSEEMRSRANLKLSLGAQTLSHELARLVLLEQIYRSFSVIRGHPYHNED